MFFVYIFNIYIYCLYGYIVFISTYTHKYPYLFAFVVSSAIQVPRGRSQFTFSFRSLLKLKNHFSELSRISVQGVVRLRNLDPASDDAAVRAWPC